MQSIITVENLGKQYRIGTRDAAYGTLRDTLVRAVRRPLKGLSAGRPKSADRVWALQKVSFEVKPGEVLGIIGRNGAGKSTLLKILSRIVAPTTGKVKLYGRVGSLLEVGTGFHPELSGRENVYLNGAILGMRRTEIDRKFDEIVAFAEIERFIDTPVKHYSSGMYMRLAFAVAAHLEPEIFIVDEVLAVGDAAFQKKCLGKMDDVAKQGRTVLLVSHNMSVIGSLCPTSIYLNGGTIQSFGETMAVIADYMASAEPSAIYREWTDLESAPGDEYLRAVKVEVVGADQEPIKTLRQDSAFRIRIEYRVLQKMRNANVGFELKDANNVAVFRSFDADNPQWNQCGREPGFYRIECLIPARLLNEGRYGLSLLAGIPFVKICLRAEDVISLDIASTINQETPDWLMGVRRSGVIAPALEWQVHYEA